MCRCKTSSPPTQSDDNDSFDVRVDHHWNERADLAFRYSFGDRDLFEPFTGPSFAAVAGFGDTKTSQSKRYGSPDLRGQSNLVNETRLHSAGSHRQ
jgi:hypothetical protein